MSAEALLTFLAHSRELERESEERYAELAESMAVHHNGEVARFFEDMARQAREHLAEVRRIGAGKDLPTIDPWEFQWPDAEPPESTSYEALHYRMSLPEAVELALDSERAAERYYRDYGERSGDAAVRRVAERFAAEEAEHATALERRLQDLSETPAHKREDDDPPHVPA